MPFQPSKQSDRSGNGYTHKQAPKDYDRHVDRRDSSHRDFHTPGTPRSPYPPRVPDIRVECVGSRTRVTTTYHYPRSSFMRDSTYRPQPNEDARSDTSSVSSHHDRHHRDCLHPGRNHFASTRTPNFTGERRSNLRETHDEKSRPKKPDQSYKDDCSSKPEHSKHEKKRDSWKREETDKARREYPKYEKKSEYPEYERDGDYGKQDASDKARDGIRKMRAEREKEFDKARREYRKMCAERDETIDFDNKSDFARHVREKTRAKARQEESDKARDEYRKMRAKREEESDKARSEYRKMWTESEKKTNPERREYEELREDWSRWEDTERREYEELREKRSGRHGERFHHHEEYDSKPKGSKGHHHHHHHHHRHEDFKLRPEDARRGHYDDEKDHTSKPRRSNNRNDGYWHYTPKPKDNQGHHPKNSEEGPGREDRSGTVPPRETATRKPPLTDHYATLGISTNATVDEIKKAARSKRVETHPDKLKKEGMSSSELERIDTAAALVGQAADILQDPEQKAKYDRERACR